MKWLLSRNKAWKTPFPLPVDTAETAMADGGGCENFGLLLDRYVGYNAAKGGLQLIREFSNRVALTPDFEKQQEMLQAIAQRWRAQAKHLGAVTCTARPQWRVIVGLSTNIVLEAGMTVDPVFGVPVIPGSALKGITRSYAQRVLGEPTDHLDVQFGWQAEEQGGCGDLIFLTGVPVTPPRVERDVINPVFTTYYRGQEAPASYLSPTPFFFLAVCKGSYYQFGVASLSGNQESAQEGARWLQEAMHVIGTGAKTAAGYGAWIVEPVPQSDQ